MKQPSKAHYRTFYPAATVKGKRFNLEYRQASRTFDLYHEDKLIGKYRHSDLALLAALEVLTGFKGDEVPDKHKGILNSLATQFCLTYQGLIDD